MKDGLVINTQRFSVHDGPGIRTLVFMKGCPLRCLWCSNPESQKGEAEFGYIESKCVRCGKCIEVCPNDAIKATKDGQIVTDRNICERCGQCVEACTYEARQIAGERISLEELVEEVEKDRDFYGNSGGGVTVGGGEPAYQPEFVRAFLKRCHDRWLHTALETCGYTSWEQLKGILEYVDFLLYDIKHMDPAVHKRITGVSNKRILQNFNKIMADGTPPDVVVRVPIIPGLNDTEANIRATAEFVSGSRAAGIELLPYHRLGMSKYEQFGMKYGLEDTANPSDEHMEKLKGIIDSYGLGIQED